MQSGNLKLLIWLRRVTNNLQLLLRCRLRTVAKLSQATCKKVCKSVQQSEATQKMAPKSRQQSEVTQNMAPKSGQQCETTYKMAPKSVQESEATQKMTGSRRAAKRNLKQLLRCLRSPSGQQSEASNLISWESQLRSLGRGIWEMRIHFASTGFKAVEVL